MVALRVVDVLAVVVFAGVLVVVVLAVIATAVLGFSLPPKINKNAPSGAL